VGASLSRGRAAGVRRDADARHESFLRYARFRWLKIALIASAATIAAFMLLSAHPGYDLSHNGGTWFGYTTGSIGALLMLWLTALGIRKRAITRGSWSLKAWVSAHVYLGLALAAIITLHTGFQFGSNVHTLAYVLMLGVIVTGIFGVLAYAYLPRWLSDSRIEMTQEQMIETIRGLDARLHEAALPLDPPHAELVRLSLQRTVIDGSVFQRLTGYYGNCGTLRALVKIERLDGRNHLAADPLRRGALDHVLGLLKQKRAALARMRRYIRIRSLLELWLFVHVPLTFATLAAVTAHVVSVFFYW
jgi:TRAP-type C4-dicarboxylate transport system permease small subunit